MAGLRLSADLEAVCRTNLWLRTRRPRAAESRILRGTRLRRSSSIKRPHSIGRDGFPSTASFRCAASRSAPNFIVFVTARRSSRRRLSKSSNRRIGRPGLPSSGALFAVEVSLLKDCVTLCIDTTGPGLHKRGYRTLVGPAPLKETLAAALVQLSLLEPRATVSRSVLRNGDDPDRSGPVGPQHGPRTGPGVRGGGLARDSQEALE